MRTAQLAAFSSGLGNQGLGGQGMGQPLSGPASYGGTFGPQSPPPRKSNLWIWLVGGLGLSGLAICGCCGAAMLLFMSHMTSAIENEITGHPVLEQHLGTIQSVSMNWAAMVEETERRGQGVTVFVFDVKGRTADGQLIGEQARQPQQGYMYDKIDLRLESGEVISLK